jgi:hypothetical protein
VDWIPLLDDLAAQLDSGRLYARDLPALAEALARVGTAFERRTRNQRRNGS